MKGVDQDEVSARHAVEIDSELVCGARRTRLELRFSSRWRRAQARVEFVDVAVGAVAQGNLDLAGLCDGQLEELSLATACYRLSEWHAERQARDAG